MSFAASWYRASCALLLLTLCFSMFSFYPPFLLSLSLFLSLSLSLSLSPPSMSLCGCKTRVIWCPLPSILFLINLTFHTLSLHSSYKIHQPFTDYLLRLPSSELLEKHLFSSRANRRLVSMVPSPLPHSNSLKQLRANSTTFACAPRTWYYAFGNFPHTIDTTGVHKQGTPFLSLLDAKDALTMIARFMNHIIFRGEFRVAWGTIRHQDAFATMLVGHEHTFQSITCVRKSHERYYPTAPHPTPNHWRSSSVASREYASHMNVIIPPHPTQPPTTDVAAA